MLLLVMVVNKYKKQILDEAKSIETLKKERNNSVIENEQLAKELTEFEKSKEHPFYQTYLKSSEVEREKIKALIHISRDYSSNQYWFNIIFLWMIAFFTLWFLGLILEAIIILVRQEDAERRGGEASKKEIHDSQKKESKRLPENALPASA